MLTAILLLERGHLDDIVTAPNGVQYLPDSSLHLKPGEKLTLRDLLYALLLRSANDTAVTGAVYLSGSVPAFAKEMNAKAKEIGATHSTFCHPRMDCPRRGIFQRPGISRRSPPMRSTTCRSLIRLSRRRCTKCIGRWISAMSGSRVRRRHFSKHFREQTVLKPGIFMQQGIVSSARQRAAAGD